MGPICLIISSLQIGKNIYLFLIRIYFKFPFHFLQAVLRGAKRQSPLNGLLLADVEEPIFEEDDNFFHCVEF